MNVSDSNFACPFRIDTQAHALHLFVVYDANARVVREMDDFDEAVEYVAAANGVSIEDVRAEVANQTHMYAEYMRSLKENRRADPAATSTVSIPSHWLSPERPNTEEVVTAARQLLELTRRGEEPESLKTVILALNGAVDQPDQYAFYFGRPRRPLDEVWGDNERSYWAHIDRVSIGNEEGAFIVTLVKDGGICRQLGTFPSEQEALKCLARHGKFEKP